MLKKIWTKAIKPVFDAVVDVARRIWDDHLKPLLANILDLVGTLIDAALDIYNKCLAPIIGWLVDFFGPKIAAFGSWLANLIGNIVGGILDVINDIIDALKGVINFIAGVFTGDWQRAWDGIKQIFKGVWDALVDIVKIPLNYIIDLVNGMTDAIEWAVNGIIDCLNEFNWTIPDWVPGVGGKSFGFDIDNIDIPEIPHLATGTVVPANFGEFHAILGDNKREPEVVSPISTIEKAVENVLARSGNDKPIIVQCVLNGREIGRVAVKAVNNDKVRRGV